MPHYFKLKRNPFSYRRKLPHLQLSDCYFVTFSTHERWELPPQARTQALESCMYEHGRTILMVMPDHAHMLFHVLNAGMAGEPLLYEILGAIKGASSHKMNRLLVRAGRVWVGESFDRMARRRVRALSQLHHHESGAARTGLESGRLRVALV